MTPRTKAALAREATGNQFRRSINSIGLPADRSANGQHRSHPAPRACVPETREDSHSIGRGEIAQDLVWNWRFAAHDCWGPQPAQDYGRKLRRVPRKKLGLQADPNYPQRTTIRWPCYAIRQGPPASFTENDLGEQSGWRPTAAAFARNGLMCRVDSGAAMGQFPAPALKKEARLTKSCSPTPKRTMSAFQTGGVGLKTLPEATPNTMTGDWRAGRRCRN